MNAIVHPTPGAVLPFNFEGKPVRVVNIDGLAWFVGKDVCERLGYADPTNAMKQHCRWVVKYHPIPDALGRDRDTRILSQPDVFRLVVGSTLPDAVRFEAWVFEDVLPAIQRDGGYMLARPQETPEELALRAMAVLQATVERQKAQLAAAAPAVQAIEQMEASEGSFSITVAAKLLKVAPRQLPKIMEREGWGSHKADGFVAYQVKIRSGHLEHEPFVIHHKRGGTTTRQQVKVTAKGLAALAKMIGLEAPAPTQEAA